MKPNILLYACSANCCSFNVTPNHYLCVFVHMCLILHISCIIMLFYAIHTFVCQRHFPFSLQSSSLILFYYRLELRFLPFDVIPLVAKLQRRSTEVLILVQYLSSNIMVYKPYDVELLGLDLYLKCYIANNFFSSLFI